MLLKSYPERAEELMDKAIEDNDKRWNFYKQMAAMHYDDGSEEE